ncbi:hypothetical protein GCM10025870_16910 [Agromyces marinus]|uniref:histidine kinase n=1 Tax=Agromyces marinus TaxID=1389020 RepID=A0ABN6YF97_9MICO|nr:ATP-binding protein [Agromyces marinus]BDZ54618.1 hypothetical protein GCM10025870_16910 [Agromyces marinus]
MSLEFTASAAGTVDGDAVQLGRVVTNLLANAMQHTPAGGRIAVAVAEDDGRVRLEVVDGGPGFAVDDLPHAFEAGWRGSDARSPHRLDVTGGAGLGLAIVRGIARAHSGDATVANAAGAVPW